MKMRLARWTAGIGLGTLAVAGLLLAPALQAQESRQRISPRHASMPYRGVGIFTPAAADPQVAAVLARSGLPQSGFRFTPSDSRRAVSNRVTVAVRAQSTRAVRVPVERNAAQPATVSLAPVAYDLGVSVGWKRFSVSGDVTRVDLVTQPGGRERADVGVTYTGKRASGRVQAIADRPLPNSPALISDKPSYSIDVGGSYSLTRNFDVTAGVRYKTETERERLPRLTDNRRDSQAVYVGTAFRF
ncbi:hypothetical protein OF829_06040 [Sphingomonas sp. LB-2]|uniref:hypothetical protein n=1 Tax=Sphingomonas caeni TaxID=2984949 RepID=UPI002231C9BC|nr:hypothetical protein [Sphingomonas caeni]MCW3846792.1 hypothetical protein [Sphingomonas caeni]